MSETESLKRETPTARLSYPQLTTTAVIEGKDTGHYTAVLVFPKSYRSEANNKQLAALGQLEKQAVMIRFGSVPPRLKRPWKDGTEWADRDGFDDGVKFIRVSTKQKPPLWKLIGGKAVPATADEFYAGCYVRAIVNAYAWQHPQGGRGVSFGVLGILKVADGPKFGMSASAEEFNLESDAAEEWEDAKVLGEATETDDSQWNDEIPF